jgi:pro-apoptotic serine protease NMA111
VTFDNVNWVVTMKKNDHYFPTTEWIKDQTESCGWHRVTYEDGKPIKGEGHDGINNVAADSFDVDEGGMVS